jgi:hypothetical protein
VQAISRTLAAPITVQALEDLALNGGGVGHGAQEQGQEPKAPRRPERRSNVVAQVGVADGAQVVQFVDRRTGELVAQLPPEAVLRLVEQLVDRARRRLA